MHLQQTKNIMDIHIYLNSIPCLILHYMLLWLLASSCLHTGITVVESCMEVERLALLTFKQDLTDPSARLSSWVGQQCCEWEGISCNNHSGHVAAINLRNPYPYTLPSDDRFITKDYEESCLAGELNPSLLVLKHVSYLDLSYNGFQGIQIPKFIGQLTSLRYLNLSNDYSSSSFVGDIPLSLGNLSNLNYLDLNHNPGLYSKNLNWLSHLSSLKYLNLGEVNLDETGVSWLHDINMLPSLLELHLFSCQISGNQLPFSLPTINFTSLSVLDMSYNYINSSFPKWMFNLTSLTNLDLGGNPFIRPSFNEFVSLKSLEYLDLRDIGLEGRVPKFSVNLCKLKSLNLAYNTLEGGLQEFLSGFLNCSFKRIESLEFSECGLAGKIPSSLGMLKNLQHLKLGSNSFWGSIPEFVAGNLSSSLKTLDLSDNLFNGSIPQSLGQLTQLVNLYLKDNAWEGSLTEANFINLTKLQSLDLGTTRPIPIIFNVTDYRWIPPFQLKSIDISNCRVGPGFPIWLHSQIELFSVILPNSSISGAIPGKWLFEISSHIQFLDLSHNQITGKLPFHLYSFPNLLSIGLSHNQIDGTIPSSVCSIESLQQLALSNNQLSGEFPKEWSLWSSIAGVDVSNNNLSGSIPSSMGIPISLLMLKMDNNNFRGEIPSALQNCSSLKRLYLRGNQFTGSIPSWIGSKVSTFTVLQLQSNSLSGHIPQALCSLPSLMILDLSHNKLSGTVPKCLSNLTSLVVQDIDNFYYSEFEVTTVTVKGRASEYSPGNAKLLAIIDLSSNDLEGEIPEEISSLIQLSALNLSMNQLTGNIPSKIGSLHLLETLDLSQNQLSGYIPQSLSNLTFLSHLNLSCNNLIGRIPSGNQLQTLDDPSIYQGNHPTLCGFPLLKCHEDGDNKDKSHAQDKKDHDNDDEEKLGLYTSVVLGFIVGFWSVCGTLILKKSWRYAYFQFFDNIKEKVALAVALKVARLQGRVVT